MSTLTSANASTQASHSAETNHPMETSHSVETSHEQSKDSSDANKEESILNANEDHLLLSASLNVLNNQLNQSQQDITTLTHLREQALSNPHTFVSNFLNKKLGHIPSLQRIVAAPKINLNKYRQHATKHSTTSGISLRRRYPNMFRKSTMDHVLEQNAAQVMGLSNTSQQLDQDIPQTESSTTITLESNTNKPKMNSATHRLSGARYLPRNTPVVRIPSAPDTTTSTNTTPTPHNTTTSTHSSQPQTNTDHPQTNDRVPSLHVSDPVHHGFMCDACHIQPIVGTRWHCKNCTDDDEVDLCRDCIHTNFEKESHTRDHTFIAIHMPEEYWDDQPQYDYLGF